jgi:hypothetical protein
MVCGKPSAWLARQVDISHHSIFFILCSHAPMCGSKFCIADRSTVIQSRCRCMSCILDVRMVLQPLMVVLIQDPEYEGNGCPERKVSEHVS